MLNMSRLHFSHMMIIVGFACLSKKSRPSILTIYKWTIQDFLDIRYYVEMLLGLLEFEIEEPVPRLAVYRL